MAIDNVSRRSLLKAAGSAGIMGRLPEAALAFPTTGQVTHEVATGPLQEHTPEHTIKFAVIGLDHNHINGISDTIRRSGGWDMPCSTMTLHPIRSRPAPWLASRRRGTTPSAGSRG